MTKGIYPDVLKLAVVPTFKSGNPSAEKNYWPVPTLPIFNKIYESFIEDLLTS